MGNMTSKDKNFDPRNYPVSFTIFVLIFSSVIGSIICPPQYSPVAFSIIILLIALSCRCPNDLLLTSPINYSALKLYWPIFIYLLITPLMLGGFNFSGINSQLIIYMTGIGFFEELLMHGFCLGLLLRKTGKDSYKSVLKAAIISSALFGIFHLFMIVQNPKDVHWIALRVSTVFFAFFFNLGSAGLAFRTNSIWPAAITHAIVDIVVFNVGEQDVMSKVISDWWIKEGLISIALTAPFGLYGIWLIKNVYQKDGRNKS